MLICIFGMKCAANVRGKVHFMRRMDYCAVNSCEGHSPVMTFDQGRDPNIMQQKCGESVVNGIKVRQTVAKISRSSF